MQRHLPPNMMNKPSIDENVGRYSSNVLDALENLLPQAPSEALLRRRIEPILDQFCSEIGLTGEAEPECYVAKTLRLDTAFHRLALEFKKPGELSSQTRCDKWSEKLGEYVRSLASRDRRDSVAGILFDGERVVFERLRKGTLHVERPMPVKQSTIERMLRWLASLMSGAALNAENLSRDFSIEQPHVARTVKSLHHSLRKSLTSQPNGMVSHLFAQWKTFFSEAVDYTAGLGPKKLKVLTKWTSRVGLDVRTTDDADKFFYALHTYFALLVKLLAYLALSRAFCPRLEGPLFQDLLGATSAELCDKLDYIERGGVFEHFGFENLLEGDFFSWYLYAWDDDIYQALQHPIVRLAEYDPATLAVAPDETRDLLKHLYQSLLPKTIRHNLGEYYTPDWLAEYLLQQVDSSFFSDEDERLLKERFQSIRWLDPACGSGTFLVLLVQRYKEIGEVLMLGAEEVGKRVLDSVVGFDINPLAVMTARVNYLLSMGGLLESLPRPVSLPVYLADSVCLPKLDETDGSAQIEVASESFRIPAILLDRQRLDSVSSETRRAIEGGLPFDTFLERISRAPETSGLDQEGAREALSELYGQFVGLHNRGADGFWSGIIRNNVAPVSSGVFDYVIGNPPWVNWEHLPDGYRERIKPLWKQYGLFSAKGLAGAFTKDDISTLMTYVAADRFLKPEGTLGFVITQAVFKAEKGGAGFRGLTIPSQSEDVPLRIVRVDDMVKLRPFEGASNRTACFVLQKGHKTVFPVPYQVWDRKNRGALRDVEPLATVKSMTKRKQHVAEPVDPDDPTSPWLSVPADLLLATRNVLGASSYRARAGTYTGGANAVFWVEVVRDSGKGLVAIRNLTAGTKLDVPRVPGPISVESSLLYPLLRSGDVQKWAAKPVHRILLTHRPGMRQNAIPEGTMQTEFRHAWEYLKRFEDVLKSRSGWEVKQAMAAGKPFYTMSEIGDYTFAKWKVVWTRMGAISAAVVGDEAHLPVIPQETVTLVACGTEQEAHFICGLVNSTPFQFAAEAYSQAGGKALGSPHVLRHIQIPAFDCSDDLHLAIASLSQHAHAAAEKWGDVALREGEAALQRAEAELDGCAARLWQIEQSKLQQMKVEVAS